MENESFKSEKLEDEYQFSEAEGIPAFTDTLDKKNIFERIKRKNFIIALVIISMLLGAYKLMAWMFASKPTSSKSVPITSISKPAIITPPIKPLLTTPTAVQLETTKFNQKLSTIEAQHQAMMDKLSAQTNDLQNTLTNIDERLNRLSNVVQDLISQQQTQQQLQAQKVAKQKMLAKKEAEAPKLIYYVRALIPGRAWLETQHGKTITISLGDHLPGYGIVTSINTEHGTITTNAGAIIGYSPNDS